MSIWLTGTRHTDEMSPSYNKLSSAPVYRTPRLPHLDPLNLTGLLLLLFSSLHPKASPQIRLPHYGIGDWFLLLRIVG
ncbi:hypothetical protein ACP70R_022883 [Stipagrostis hirtigluma subsp. patula]